jgi:hypothetical protein
MVEKKPPQGESETQPITVTDRVTTVADTFAAVELYARILRSVRSATARRRKEQDSDGHRGSEKLSA